MLQSLLVPVLTTLQSELNTSQATVTWVLTSYLLSASIFTPIIGRVGDMFGKRRIFVATLGVLAIGLLLAALATNVGVMIVARAIQGVGGGVLPLAFGIIRDEFPAAKIAGAVGALASLVSVGVGVGVVLAGPIVDARGHRWLFWCPMIITTVAALAAYVFVPESPVRTRGKISWVPVVLLSGWLVTLLVPLSQAPRWGWVSGKVLGLAALSVLLFVAWVMSERRAESPLIDFDIIRRPGVATGNLVAFLIGIGVYGVFAFLPQYVQTPTSVGYGFGASITGSGLMMLPSAAGSLVAGLFAGRLTRNVGVKAVIVLGSVLSAASLVILAWAHHDAWEIYAASSLIGVGSGLVFAALAGLIVRAVPPEQTGVASGMNANIRTIGGSVGTALMASVVTAYLSPTGLPEEFGYTVGFAVLSLALVGAAVAGLAIPRSFTPAPATHTEEVKLPERGALCREHRGHRQT